MDTQILRSVVHEQLSELLSDAAPLILRSPSLEDTLQVKEITVITGVRRSGKSTIVRSLVRALPHPAAALYVNFDDPRLMEFSASDFETLYKLWLDIHGESAPRIAVFDEIQNVNGWERWMTFFAEQKKWKVYITGSNSKLLSSELSTHLTGRHRDIILHPLSFQEISRDVLPELSERGFEPDAVYTLEEQSQLNVLLRRYLFTGGFPRVWQSGDRGILGEYFTDIVSRDIVQRHSLRQTQFISRLGVTVMSDVGRKLNKTRLAATLGIKEANTVNAYLGYFSECYLGHEIRKFDLSVRKQMRSLAKFYAIDAGLAQRVGISDSSKETFYFENMVFIELLRRQATVYYWQEGNSPEIDFVVETSDGERHLVQVAWNVDTDDTLHRELSAFQAFNDTFPRLTIHRRVLITFETYKQRTIQNVVGRHSVEVVPFFHWALMRQRM